VQYSPAIYAVTRRAHGLSGWEAAALKEIAEELDAEESITLEQFNYDPERQGHSDQASLRVYVNVTPGGHSVALAWRLFVHLSPEVLHSLGERHHDDAVEALEAHEALFISRTLTAVKDMGLPPGTYLVEWTFGMHRSAFAHSAFAWFAEQAVFRGQPRWQEVGAVLQSPKWSKP
jgi:hypothetical protein